MARPPACNPKWDWDLAFALFCGGMTDQQIMNHPDFRGLPKSTLISARSKQDWSGRRDRLARLPTNNAVDNAAKRLQDNLQNAGIEHQEFMLLELERERNTFSRRQKSQDDQLERLRALKELDQMARQTSRLDEQKPQNPVTQGFAILVHLQTNQGGPTTPKPTHSAIEILPDHLEASMGILRSNNAHVEAADEVEITSEPPPGDLKAMPAPGSLFGTTPLAARV